MDTSSRTSLIRWVHVSDLQFGQEKSDHGDHVAAVEELVSRVRAEDPAFVINSGDHVGGAGSDDEKKDVARWWRDYRRVVGPLARQCPIYSCPGNHDQTRPGRTLDLYCKQTGRPAKPPYYSIRRGPMEIVFLDLTMRVGEYDPKLTSTCRVMHAGAFPPRTVQHRWLQRTLSRRRGQVLVVVGHWPIFMSRFVYHDADSSLRFDELTGYPGELLPMLTEAGADLYLCGHHHVYERSRHPRLMQIMTAGDAIAWPDLMERPNKYRVRVDRRMCYTRFCYDPTSARIHGESIAIDGETIDAWSQKVRTK